MPTEIFLRDEFETAWLGQNVFDAAEALEGVGVRAVASRSTIRFTMDGRTYYAKRHGGVGWAEVLKNWLTLKQPVLDASNEYRAAAHLKAHGLNSLTVAAYGRTGLNPAGRRSFLVTDEISPVLSLEQFCLPWPEAPPSVKLKRSLIEHVAHIATTMHGAGINHRDFYICHLLLTEPHTVKDAPTPIFVVDLHRAQLRKKVPHRWLVRDLAALWFSSRDIGLTQRDVFRFLRAYFRAPLRTILNEHANLLARVDRRADRLYVKAKAKGILPSQLAARAQALQ